MEEIAHVLIELGLTERQAKFLVTLSRFEYATVKDLSEAANVHRQEVYEVLIELQKIGLVEKKIGSPNQYRTSPISESLEILLERKNKLMSEIRKKTEALMKYNVIRKNTAEENDFTFVSGVERFRNALFKWVENAETIDEVLLLDRFSFQIAETLETQQLQYKDNVKIRIVTSATPENLKDLKVNAKNYQLQFAPFPLPADIAIYDRKRAHIAIFSNRESPIKNEVGCLTSNHPYFVQMLQNYFDVLWQISRPNKK